MDIGKAFSFVFEDEQWITKILLGAVITLIPIFGGFALMGYAIAVLRNVMAGNPHPLPAWDDLGGYFMDGLMVWVATLVYALPFFVFICPLALVWVLPAFAGDSQDAAVVLAGIAGILNIGLGCLAFLYGLLLQLLTPVVQIRYAETGQLGACLRFGEILRFLFSNIGNIVVSQLLFVLAGMVLVSVLGGLSLGLLILPISVWLSVFSSHLYGQTGKRAGLAPQAVASANNHWGA